MVTHTLFGFPVIMTKLDPKSYDKKSIVSAIEKNFKLNKTRNNWDTQSVMHHSYDDVNNPRYHKVKFASLIPVYQKIITNIFKNMIRSTILQLRLKVLYLMRRIFQRCVPIYLKYCLPNIFPIPGRGIHGR